MAHVLVLLSFPQTILQKNIIVPQKLYCAGCFAGCLLPHISYVVGIIVAIYMNHVLLFFFINFLTVGAQALFYVSHTVSKESKQ